MDNPSRGARVRPPPNSLLPPDREECDREASEVETGLFGQSPAMRRLRTILPIYARSSSSVVVLGETGTGKELVARALHRLGPRPNAPFVATNSAAIPESLVSSELFGHERGAFTGANCRHRGLFEQADKGTLFLDEIADLIPDTQARLLRVLETGEIRALGSERTRTVSVRLLVATHTPLAPLVSTGQFRADLFFRLQTLIVTIPALRERIEDVPRICEHLLTRLAPEIGPRHLHPEAVKRLKDYGWPGNVRQLANVLRRASVREGTEISARCIEEALAQEPRARPHVRDGATVAMIRDVLQHYGGRISPTARFLGCARSTLRARIRRHGIVLEP